MAPKAQAHAVNSPQIDPEVPARQLPQKRGYVTARDSLTARERADLQRELDALQPVFDGKATKHYADMVGNTLEPPPIKSKAERMFELMEEGKALGAEKNHNASQMREELLLRKDGMDMSLSHLRQDAARMRKTVTEVDIALGKRGREKAAALVAQQPVPRHVVQQFSDQQSILVEQRRQLEALKGERQQLLDEQHRVLAQARRDYYDGMEKPTGVDSMAQLPDPITLREAHALLRDETTQAVCAGHDGRIGNTEEGPAQDGYLLVEVYSIDGVRLEAVSSFGVKVVDRSDRSVVTEATVAGPLEFDGMRPKSAQLTIPADSGVDTVDVAVTLNGSDGSATAKVPFGSIGENRQDPQSFRFTSTGEWESSGASVSALIAMSGMAPRADAQVWANTRVAERPTSANISRFPGRELAPSQGFLRGKVLAWQEDGCPDPADNLKKLREVAPSRVTASPKLGSLGPDQRTMEEIRSSDRPGVPFAGFAHPQDPAAAVEIRRSTGGAPRRRASRPFPVDSDEDYSCQVPLHPWGDAARGIPGSFGGSSSSTSSASHEAHVGRGQSFSDSGRGGCEDDAWGQKLGAFTRSRRGSKDPGKENQWQGRKIGKGRSEEAGFATRSAPLRRSTVGNTRPRSARDSQMRTDGTPFFADQHASRNRSMPARKESGTNGFFAAFAGEAEIAPALQHGRRVAPNQPGSSRGKHAKGIQLRPPSMDATTVEQRFHLLREATMDGQLGNEDAQLMLDFSALVAQPGALHDTGKRSDEQLAEYAGMLLDGLAAYGRSATLCLSIMEALVAVHGSVSQIYAGQLGVALYAGFEKCAFRFQTSDDLSLHRRMVALLVAVISPDCIIDAAKLTDYILAQTGHYQSRMPPIMAEQALGILCVAGAMHRQAEQIGTALLMLRAYKSDPHLAIRALVTLAEVYEFIEQDRQRLDAEQPKDAFLQQRRIPTDTGDVRLVNNTMDLYPGHRKVAGAALRALAVLAKVSDARLHMILSDGQRVMMHAQRRHVGSRSVNLHVAEIMRVAAHQRPEWITEGSVYLVSHSLRAYWRDTDVAIQCLECLAALVDGGMQYERVVDIFPVSQSLLLGDVHFHDHRVATPLNRLIRGLAEGSREHLLDLGKSGAVSVCVRALESNPQELGNVRAAATAIKALAAGSPDALRHVVRLGGSKSLFDALVAQRRDADCVRTVLAALAVVGQDETSRKQLVNPEDAEGAMVIVSIRRVATEMCLDDPDILAQACLAVGTLTFQGEDAGKGKQKSLRQAFDEQHIADAVAELLGSYPDCPSAGYFVRLMNSAAMCDLSDKRMLSHTGEVVGKLETKHGRMPAREKEAKSKRKAATLSWGDAKGGKLSNGGYDLFKPLRGLGVGKGEIPEEPLMDQDEEAAQDEIDEEERKVLGKYQAVAASGRAQKTEESGGGILGIFG